MFLLNILDALSSAIISSAVSSDLYAPKRDSKVGSGTTSFSFNDCESLESDQAYFPNLGFLKIQSNSLQG